MDHPPDDPSHRLSYLNAIAALIDGFYIRRALKDRRALTDLTGYEPANETVAAIENPSGEPVAPPVVTAAIIASPDFQKR